MKRIKLASIFMALAFVLSSCDRGMNDANDIAPERQPETPSTPQQP